MTAGADPRTAVPAGNTFDKYGTANPVARAVVGRFERALGELLDHAAPRSILDVGCGEGVLTQRWAHRYAGADPIVGVDLEDPDLRAEWAGRSAPNLTFAAADGAHLPFADSSFDLVCAIETLEHVTDPASVVAEMRRCAQRTLIVSVPLEPLWRALNLARGAYWRAAGNTPGHLHHFSRRSITALLARHGDVDVVRTPLPWTMVLVRV